MCCNANKDIVQLTVHQRQRKQEIAPFVYSLQITETSNRWPQWLCSGLPQNSQKKLFKTIIIAQNKNLFMLLFNL